MRETKTTLEQQTTDLIRDDSITTTTGMSATPDVISREINKAIRFIYDYLLSYKVQGDPIVISTVADQQFYPYPPRLNWIHSVTWEVGGVHYPLEVVESESSWNNLNMIDYSGSTYPQYIFPRKNDFGLFPIPRTTSQDITFNAHYIPKDLILDDYTTGTITMTNNSAGVVGVGTTFTSAMVGKWITATTDGDWYRILSVTDDTNLTLSRTFFGTTVTAGAYKIGDSPDIPEVLHELIPYRSAGNWYQGVRRDTQNAQPLLNYFWTGDYGNPNREGNIEGGLIGYKNRATKRGREKSTLVRRNKSLKFLYNERWTTTISDS